MKFMKLGSKPDGYQVDGNSIRYLATELASDIVVNLGEMKFFLHKFPLLCKSLRFQKLVANTDTEDDEIHLPDFPGGTSAFEICVKFCYGMSITLNAHNIVLARCAAEYLGMYESVEKGNLIYKIEVFLDVSIFQSWKDSITVLKSTKSFLPQAEDLDLVRRCVKSISDKASTNPTNVSWSFTYNRKRPQQANFYSDVENSLVPQDWWAEDLAELDIDFYKRIMVNIKSNEKVSDSVIGEALRVFVFRRVKGFSMGMVHCGDLTRTRSVVDAIVSLLPKKKSSVSCSFMLKLLKAAMSLDSNEIIKQELIQRIAQQLEEASVSDLLIRSPKGAVTTYDVDTVTKMVKEFSIQVPQTEAERHEFQEGGRQMGIFSDVSSLMVAKLIDGYLAEISKDQHLPVSKFVELAEMLSCSTRPSHDAMYRAIDTYLKEHPGISKTDKKNICKLIDCRKLSVDACMHAVQNERLPLRMAVQVLMLEQARATTASACATPNLRKCSSTNLHSRSLRSVATNSENQEQEELKALKIELVKLKLASGSRRHYTDTATNNNSNKAILSKFKSFFTSSKVMAKLQPSKRASAANTPSSVSSKSPKFITKQGTFSPAINKGNVAQASSF